MCGIWTKIKRHGRVEPPDVARAVRMLAHRGPDGYRWIRENGLAMAHTRLSIIDLKGGAQPLVTEDQRFVGIVNGELYDFQMLRAKLERDGVVFSTKSDSEVLLKLFTHHGAEGLRGLSGEFAFSFFDRKLEKLYFGRDLHGVKPLFIRVNERELMVASEIKAIIDAPAELDEEYALRFIARLMTPPKTAIRGVEHVLPGRLYCFDIKTWRLTWQTLDPLPIFNERTLRGDEAFRALDDALSKSVRRRLKADVDVGVYLSGGIDSAMVAALAVEQGAKPKAFTVGFDDIDFDETQDAREIAQALGIEHFEIKLTGRNFFEHLNDSILAFENPVSNPHGAAKNLLASYTAQHVKVVLTGEGADEWLGGYAYQRIEKLRRFEETHPRFAQGALKTFMQLESKVNMQHLAGESRGMSLLASEQFFSHAPAILTRSLKPRVYEYLTGCPLDRLSRRAFADLRKYLLEETVGPHATPNEILSRFAGPCAPREIDVWMGLRTDLLAYILANVGDRQEMAHSLEGRTPFLDLDVINVASRLHPIELVSRLREKALLRKIGRTRLPAAFTVQRKKPFFSPLKYIYTSKARAKMDDAIEVAEKALPGLSWPHIHRILEQRRRGSKSSFDSIANSLSLTFYSLGILKAQLHEPRKLFVRGYSIPQNGRDVLPFERMLGPLQMPVVYAL